MLDGFLLLFERSKLAVKMLRIAVVLQTSLVCLHGALVFMRRGKNEISVWTFLGKRTSWVSCRKDIELV